MNVFDQMGVYWAEIADQNPTQRQIQFIKDNFKQKGLILDLACGTGRHMIPLSKEGYDIVGLDISPNLLKIAKSRLRGIQLVRADMRRLPFKAGTFTAAVSMDTSLGYLPTEKDDLQSLGELRETMKRGTVLIADVFNREELMQKYKTKNPVNPKEKEYPTFALSQKRTIDKDGGKLRDLWVVHDKADGKIKIFRHVARLYSLKGLQDLLEKTGFVVKQVYGDYVGQQFSPDSKRLILVATAK
jgi:ubiquinone/menaquinone biosynthesis C-methylase UbiE